MAFDKSQPAYQDLRCIFAEQSDSIVAWVGAGLSMPAGLPSWNQLRASLIAELVADANRELTEDGRESKLGKCKHAENEKDFWRSFSIIQRSMGQESYRAAIRRAFKTVEQVEVPATYRNLWELKICGMINLNVDCLAKRAFNEVYENKVVNDFSGNEVGDFIHLFRSKKQWLVNMHGKVDAASSWVFTAHELELLMQSPAYDQFIKTCFTSRTVVFLGISADDIAAGEHLRKLTQNKLDCGGHFWITHEAGKREWAEKSGIRQIIYSPANDHSELLELFTDLRNYTSVDSPAEPVVLRNTELENNELPEPELLEKETAGEIRKKLNKYASSILRVTNEITVGRFEEFAKKYSESIYRAWYVDVTPPKNEVLGYTLTELCKDGAFGTVYRATDASGKQVAIKVLHEKVRKDREMLQSFRRGVSSMRILRQNCVDGVVNYHDASEIPAIVVMDFIEGIDLVEATKKQVLLDWRDLIRTCRILTEIIRKSHKLPQRVLHRDIRPANVMIENCWGPNPKWEETKIWVLDFDLSHHLESFDVSVSAPGQANGYLAPEQVERTSGISTRNATVDSFGLGMTFYFLRTGVEPRFGQHRYADWNTTLDGVANNYPCARWRSLPYRFSRLILNSTRERQHDRLEVANIENELIWLEEAINEPYKVNSAELLAEELAARGFHSGYEWNNDSSEASLKIGNVSVTIIADERRKLVKFGFEWLQAGMMNHQDVRRWLPTAKQRINSVLTKCGWEVHADISTGTVRGNASISSSEVQKDMDLHARAIAEARDALTF